MKNKKLIYILIPLVVIIWGLIILRIVNQIHHSQAYQVESLSMSKRIPSDNTNDSTVLILKYRDPFLGSHLPISSNESQSAFIFRNNSNLTTLPKPVVNFPDTKYSGLVINSKNKRKLGLLKIENKDFLVQEGELVSGEKVLSLYADSVIISFKKMKKTILKN